MSLYREINDILMLEGINSELISELTKLRHPPYVKVKGLLQ